MLQTNILQEIDFLQLLGFESDASHTKLICKEKPKFEIVNDAVVVLQEYKHKFRHQNYL